MSRVITVYKHIVTASSSPRTAQESPGSLPVRLTFPPPAACYHNNGSLAGDFTHSSQPCVSVSQPPSHAQIEQRLIMPKEIIGTDKMWNIFCECDHLDLTLTRHSSTVPWGFTLSGGKDQGLTVKVFTQRWRIMIDVMQGRMCPPWICCGQWRTPDPGLYLEDIGRRGAGSEVSSCRIFDLNLSRCLEKLIKKLWKWWKPVGMLSRNWAFWSKQ